MRGRRVLLHDLAVTSHALSKRTSPARVELQGDHARARADQRTGEGAPAGGQVQHKIVGTDARRSYAERTVGPGRYRSGVKRAPLLALAAVVSALLATPANAGALSYADPADDATTVADADLPRPSDPELDLRDVSWTTTAEELVITTSLSALGAPVASDGWALGHYFEYEGIHFELLVQDVGAATNALFGPDGVYLRPAGDSSSEFPCVCRFTLDTDHGTVTARAELHSIGSAAKSVDPRLPRPAPGAHFAELRTISYRVAGALLAADRAAAPEGAILAV